MLTPSRHYDLVVIGSGPAGEKAAMQASKLRKKVALIEKDPVHLGGSSLHTGTIPSKSLRETVVHLELLRRRTHGLNLNLKEDITVDELMHRKQMVIHEQESSFARNIKKTKIDLFRGIPQLQASPTPLSEATEKPKKTKKIEGVETLQGQTTLLTPNILEIDHAGELIQISSDYTIVATGSRPFHPPWATFDSEQVFDSDTVLNIKYLPQKLTIIGAGVIGCEYACIFAKLGIRVNLVAKDYDILSFLDQEIGDRLKERLREQRITLRFGEEVEAVKRISSTQVETYLKSGKILPSSHVLVAAGRSSNTQGLGLETVGVKMGKRGLIEVDRQTYQTSVPNIYAVGDVVGFPGLASTAMLQARIAVLHAFRQYEDEAMPKDLPLGIWTIPPVAMVGKTEKELTESHAPYEIGIAYFKEAARAHIMGEDHGILKLLFDPKTLKLLGVHIIGPNAPELIHLGQAVMYYNGDIKYFMNAVFNHPTLDELYRVAAFNGINRLTPDL